MNRQWDRTANLKRSESFPTALASSSVEWSKAPIYKAVANYSVRAHSQCAATIVIGQYDICQLLYMDASVAGCSDRPPPVKRHIGTMVCRHVQ